MSSLAVAQGSLVALLVCACEAGTPSEPPAPQARELEAGAVATVGEERIDATTVRAIAIAQGTSLVVARDRAIRDALFAVEARAQGRAPHSAESALLARALLEQRRVEVEGPTTDEELEVLTRQHWLELDRPEGFRVVHVVVQLPKTQKGEASPGPETWSRVDAVGDEMHAVAVAAANVARLSPDGDAAVQAALQTAADSVDASGFAIRVESLDPVASDGRVLSRAGGGFDLAFATAVSRLRSRGDTTPAFRSPFGVHVAILLERTPALRVPPAERRVLVHDEALDRRLRKARADLLAPHEATVELPRNAAALLDLVSVSSASPARAEGPP